MVAEEVKVLLEANLPDAEVMVESEDNVHFNAIIVSNNFHDKKLIERQKMVYAVLGDTITSGVIHALSLKTYTKEEWSIKCNS